MAPPTRGQADARGMRTGSMGGRQGVQSVQGDARTPLQHAPLKGVQQPLGGHNVGACMCIQVMAVLLQPRRRTRCC